MEQPLELVDLRVVMNLDRQATRLRLQCLAELRNLLPLCALYDERDRLLQIVLQRERFYICPVAALHFQHPHGDQTLDRASHRDPASAKSIAKVKLVGNFCCLPATRRRGSFIQQPAYVLRYAFGFIGLF